jgi:vacuolar protein-sorting-associated protein 4
MFQLHVGTTPCELSQKDYRLLAEQTDGSVSLVFLFLFFSFVSLSFFFLWKLYIECLFRYSGSDISIVVRDALMQPVRKVISATHFKRVPSPTDEDSMKWTPCSPGDPDAEEKSWSDVESDELLEPPLKLADFLKSLSTVRPTVSEGDIKKHDEWTKQSGTSD